MGESTTASDSDFGRISGRERTKKEKDAKAIREREESFEKASYYKAHPEFKEGGHTKQFDAVNRNNSIADDLDKRREGTNFLGKKKGDNFKVGGFDLGFNPMDTSMIGLGLSVARDANYKNQASALRAGGNPVYDAKGAYQGVVGKNAFGGKGYYGNADFSPIGRSQGTKFDAATGTYTSSKIQEVDGGSDSNNVTNGSTQATATNTTNSTKSLDPGAKRTLLSNSSDGSGTTRRNFIA